MARMPRVVVPGHPLHIVQRGNNRQACFFCDDDRRLYLEKLKDAADRHECRVHAYVLMTNHVHVLLTPEESHSTSRLLQAVGRSYVRYVNSLYGRSGTLWEGRYKSTLIDSERYLLTCSRYIELNPVRAGMVECPANYPWSSYRRNALGRRDPLVSPHSVYEQLGRVPEEREAAYRELFSAQVEEAELRAIRNATEEGSTLGNDQFRKEIELALGRRVARMNHGGDRKSSRFRDSCER